MKNLLIASYDMEVGGVERSLISMLNNFDYNNHKVDLMLYSHTGDLMNLLPKHPNLYLLQESKAYKSFRMPIRKIMKSGKVSIALARLFAKYKANLNRSVENGYKQLQYMWLYTLPFLPKVEKKYDVAISYLWPHYFVAEKVSARTKIAWIHTDFSIVDTDEGLDMKMWSKFDYIMAVSSECRNAFLNKYPLLKEKVMILENITSPDFVSALASENIDNPMISDSRFKVLTVARLSYAKGIDNAVKALKILKDRGYEDITWYVVGYGGDEEMLKELILKNGLEDRFFLLGKQVNPYPFMKAADLYVQPSRYEGKAVTVGEAQILSKPVLITNYSTAQSQVNDGHDGLICELSIEGIAEGIERLFNDTEFRMQLSSNCKVTDYHNSDELENLYQLL
jgi:glycosyltransferase involved in cell wall biosynthesis